VGRGSPAAFCYEFKPNPGRLVLNYVIVTPVVRSSFAVLLLTARLQALAAGQPFFYADFWALAKRMLVMGCEASGLVIWSGKSLF